MTDNSMNEESFENQIVSNNLRDGVQNLYLDSKTADVFFKFESNESEQMDDSNDVPAHKFPLAVVSNVFYTMFYGELKEKSIVTIVDVSKTAFEEFLQFFYLREVKLTMQSVAEVMYLGGKYNVKECITVCVQFLLKKMTSDDILTGVRLANLYNNKDLETFCEHYIAWNTDEVLRSNEFQHCEKQILERILKMDLLTCSETQLFEACKSWVKVKAGSEQDLVTKEMIQKHLGDLFYEFRFTSMDGNDFNALYLSNENLFSPSEFKDVLRTFTPWPSIPTLFNPNPRRKFEWNAMTAIECDREDCNATKKGFLFSGAKNLIAKVIFTSNKPILLGEIVFAEFVDYYDGDYHHLSSDLPLNIIIIEDPKANNKTLATFEAKIPPRTKKQILLPSPIIIRPEHSYEIKLHSSAASYKQLCYYNQKGRSQVFIEPDIKISFYADYKKTKESTASSILVLKFNTF